MKTYSGIEINNDSAWTPAEIQQMIDGAAKRYGEEMDKHLEKKRRRREWEYAPGKMRESDIARIIMGEWYE